jgi:hypothetical protein
MSDPISPLSHSAERTHQLAFEDSEFLARRQTRGIRLQLELMKPDLG